MRKRRATVEFDNTISRPDRELKAGDALRDPRKNPSAAKPSLESTNKSPIQHKYRQPRRKIR